jgi:hypothetical protein
MLSAFMRASNDAGSCGLSVRRVNRALRVGASRCPLLRSRGGRVQPASKALPSRSLKLPMPFGPCDPVSRNSHG